MVEGQGPVTPGNRRKRIGANSPAYLRKMRLYIKTPVNQGFFQFEDLSLMLYLQLLKIFIEKGEQNNEQKIIHFRICYRGPSR